MYQEAAMETVIEVKDITKSFRVYYDKGSQLKEKMLFWKRNRYEERLVLKGISFDVKKGEAIGLIGHNGCGKSTTLKLLSKIMYPDHGTIEMKGRVSSLIELGAGFHPDMSGRENIYTNAAIFGLTKKEIDERVDDIIAFSELEEFIENPVRTYSSGMYMRLAFSVAINVDADILLVDEILAVGDANFQAKCFNRMREIKKNGTTIVIVSHSLGQIEQICDRSIWIQDGVIKMEGTPRDVHPAYMNYMGEKRQEIAAKEEERQKKLKEKEAEAVSEEVNDKTTEEVNTQESEVEDKKQEQEELTRFGNGKARITDIFLLDKQGKKKSVFRSDEFVRLVVKYKLKEKVENAVIGISIFRNDGLLCYGTHTQSDEIEEFDITKNGSIMVDFDKMQLLEGEYFIDFAITTDISEPVDYYKNAIKFQIYADKERIGVSEIPHIWNLEDVK